MKRKSTPPRKRKAKEVAPKGINGTIGFTDPEGNFTTLAVRNGVSEFVNVSLKDFYDVCYIGPLVISKDQGGQEP